MAAQSQRRFNWSDLESQIWGYLTALRNHNIVEPVPSMGRHFLYYVRQKTDWGVSRGWAGAIQLLRT
jgi:hypothetical protein